MLPGKEWIEKYEKVKELLVSPVHYGNLFSQDEVQGKKLFILPMGAVHFPTGNILVRDPLVYLDKNEEPYLQKVPTGIFPLETLVAEMEEDHYRYVATRVRFSDEKAAVYREALIGNEDLDDVDEESFFGFNVDADYLEEAFIHGVQYFSSFIADGLVDTEFIAVESEHSAMSTCLAASAAGARADRFSSVLG